MKKFVVLFISALIWGSVSTKPYIGDVSPEYPAYAAGIETGDLVLSIDGKKISNWDKGLVMLQTTDGEAVIFKVQKEDGSVEEYTVEPILVEDEEGNESYKFGIATMSEREYGFGKSLKYALNPQTLTIKF